MSRDGIEIGDKVTWTRSAKKGRGFTFTTRKGKVTALSDLMASVIYRGETIHLRRDKIRKEGQKTELTEIVSEFTADKERK